MGDDLEYFFKQVNEFLGQRELEEAFVRLGLTRKQAQIATKGDIKGLGITSPSGDSEGLAAAIRRLRPEWGQREIDLFLNVRRVEW